MPRSELFYADGSVYARDVDGRREYFYPNGAVKTIEERNGETVLYWPNGNVKRRCSFRKGVRWGRDCMWSEEGVLVDEGEYENGKPTGRHRRWSQKGQLLEEIVYLDEKRFDFRQWDEKGNLRTEAVWADGVNYRERVWDRFQNIWIEKEARWDGKKLLYA
jgi:antitoxin component YwqK of YwqJK toxin-antitoxin module